jgi:hypothetical protein
VKKRIGILTLSFALFTAVFGFVGAVSAKEAPQYNDFWGRSPGYNDFWGR